MINLILNYINDTSSTSIFCSGIVLPIIYFVSPLTETINKDLDQHAESKNKYDPNQGMLFNISKGVEAYEAWQVEESLSQTLQDLQESKEEVDDLALDEMWDDLKIQNRKNLEDFLANKEEYQKGAILFDKSYNRKLCKSRKARWNAKKSSRLSLFNRYHPGGKF
jgi:hypothetical protein